MYVYVYIVSLFNGISTIAGYLMPMCVFVDDYRDMYTPLPPWG